MNGSLGFGFLGHITTACRAMLARRRVLVSPTCLRSMMLLLSGSVLQSHAALAHHSTAVYDLQKTITVGGNVSKVVWLNPHAFFYVDAKSEDGTLVTWEFELHSPNEMMRRGWSRNQLKLGEAVTVVGFPSRGRAHRAFAGSVTFPDGRKMPIAVFGTEQVLEATSGK